jgi:DNA-binding PadR family transcriptional regulator
MPGINTMHLDVLSLRHIVKLRMGSRQGLAGLGLGDGERTAMTPVFRHGRLRLYLLRLLDEEPRHGYEVIRLLRDRFMGVYAPSPGTIYPRLARLEEEGLVTHDEENGRKVYRITEAGREELRSRGDELHELEQELSASVSDIVREVKEDVRETVRSLREELTKAAREVRHPQEPPARAPQEPPAPGPEHEQAAAAVWEQAAGIPGAEDARPAGERAHEQARQPLSDAPAGGTGIGGAWAQAREQARLLREQARHARDHARQVRDDLSGHDLGDWHSWGDWASWADYPGRKGWQPHDMTAFRDLERLARGFANDLRKVAWDSDALGGEVLANLRDILDEALDRIKTEIHHRDQ